jgi:hypothetical protein
MDPMDDADEDLDVDASVVESERIGSNRRKLPCVLMQLLIVGSLPRLKSPEEREGWVGADKKLLVQSAPDSPI